jgi:hypothetical protein
VDYWIRGGSGRHGWHHPNEVLEWSVIQWAKAQGYRACNFGPIDPKVARAFINGEPLPDSVRQSAASFKLGFGGQPTLYPRASDYVYNPVLRWGYRTVFPKIVHLSLVKGVQKRLRTR